MAVLDTNIIIEVGKGNIKVLDRVLAIDNYFQITSLTRFEIMIGAPKFMELNLVDSLNCLNFDRRSADLAAKIHRTLKKEGIVMSLRDLFIGSICISSGEKLITMDSDFTVLENFGLETVLLR